MEAKNSSQAVFAVLFVLCVIHQTYCVSLQTRLGPIEGVEKNVQDFGPLFIFKKIPYAKPPVGNLRFRKPEAFGNWSSTLNATEFGQGCTQAYAPTTSGEDCLHLNIFVPYDLKPQTKKSVMIWVHGGAYIGGRSSTYDGTDISLRGNVILVTINYRLGPLGFFSTGGDASPGNYGLWDQHLAFRWVHENIADYGGDSNSVTIFGESAGGGSVSFHSLYPGNIGLFQRVISQSGVATSFLLRADQSRVVEDAKELFRQLNCTSPDQRIAIECLRTLPALSVASVMLGSHAPVIDNDFVSGLAEEILAKKDSDVFKFFTSLDYMVGSLDGDGGIALSNFFTPEVQNSYNITLETGIPHNVMCDVFVPIFTKYTALPNTTEAKAFVCNMYKNMTSVEAQSNAIVDAFSDVVFTFPAMLTADFHYLRSEASSRTYAFVMTRLSPIQSAIAPYWTPSWMQRSTHTMDEVYLFHTSLYFNQTEDLQFRDKLVGYWTNFAKSGDPNGADLPTWPEYNFLKRVQILDINIQTENDIFSDRKDFWMRSLFDGEIIHQTRLGQILGNVNMMSGAGKIYTFRKIPYAKAPTGSLRFRKPELYGRWQGILNATVFGPSCMQARTVFSSVGDYGISEDCLHLNIYTPYDVTPHSNRSVMIWIHGGGFTTGAASLYDGTGLALRGNVIVVTINYRLGPLGFFSTGDDAAAGNYALWDQHLACRWVHDNIADFGGNPSSVTLFGESAGGTSVSYQSLYPGNQGLFQRVIPQSGVAVQPGGLKVREVADVYAASLGCRTNDTVALVNCLRVLSADSLLLPPARFQPVYDKDFILVKSQDELTNTSTNVYTFFSSLDLMIGTLDGDGAVLLFNLVPMSALRRYNMTLSDGIPTEVLCYEMTDVLADNFFQNNTKVSKAMCDRYKSTVSVETQSNFVLDLLTDMLFQIPALESANAHAIASGKRTYVYSMERLSPVQIYAVPSWTFPWTKRAVHTFDLVYLFSIDAYKYRGVPATEQTEDVEFGYRMQYYWTNFAKTGDPNGPGLPAWPEYDARKLVQTLDVPITTSVIDPEKIKFWKETIPGILSGKFDGGGGGPISRSSVLNGNGNLKFIMFLFLYSIFR